MKFLEILKLVLTVLPLIIDVIKAVEAAIPGEGKGEQKLAIVRAAFESAYKFGDSAFGKFEETWPIITNVISTIVSTFNNIGIFKK